MRLVIAAGGTGGHLFPGIAVAQVLREQNAADEIVFVGSERGLEQEILDRFRLRHETLAVGRIKGEGLKQKMKTFLLLPKSFFAARSLLRRIGPSVVLGIGGYSSGPVMLAAFSLMIPRAILEPNAVPGFTNRMLARFVNRIFISFPEASRFFPKKKTRLTGTPVRRELTNVGAGRGRAAPTRGAYFTVVVLGGSQGASALNEAMVRLLPELEKSGRRFRIFHQTGSKDLEAVREAYGRGGIEHEVKAFFEDMVPVYEKADLAVSRSGASTVAELIETRTPALLVPYPFAADDHQKINAVSVVQEGGAEMLLNKDLEAQLGAKILHYVSAREELWQMRKNLAELRRVPAAQMIARECRALAHEETGSPVVLES